MNNTTRRYPRSLSEAFPFGPEYGCAVTRYRSPKTTFKDYAAAIVIGVAIAVGLVYGWTA